MNRFFNPDKPLFVIDRHYPLISKGKTYGYKDHWPWKETGVNIKAAKNLFDLMKVNHVSEWEDFNGFATVSTLTPTNLDKLILRVNDRINKLTPTKQEYNKRKIKLSKIREKQEGLCRTWRNANDKWTEVANFYDETLKELYDTQGTSEAE